MRPGQLRHRVTIQELPEVLDEHKTPVPGTLWQDVATVWAAVEPLQGREFIAAQNTASELSVRVRIRYLAGVTSGMRVLYATRIFNISAVIDPEERHRELHLMCVEVKA